MIPIPAAKHRVVLATLLMRPNEVVHTGALADRLWGDLRPPSAHKTIQGYVARLRRRLGEGLIETRAPGYLAVVPPGSLDLQRFDQLVAEADRVTDPGLRSALLSSALALWRGEPLADIPSELTQRIDAARLAEARIHVLGKRVDADLRLGKHTALIPELRELVGEHPYHEDFARQLIVALHHSGRRADALAVYRTTRENLVGDIGVEPSRRLNSIHDLVLSSDAGAPPRVPPAQLPPGIADFVGRKQELETLRSFLTSSGASPIACVSGPGGIGKTTLAVHTGQALRADYPDGRLYADLATAGPFDILGGFLEALGVEGSALPATLTGRNGLFRTMAADRKLLLLLDNASTEEQVRPLLPGGTGSATIITCRVTLAGLAGARHLQLGPPPIRDAVELLARIAGPDRVDAEPSQAAEIARLCGCLPLAMRIIGGRLILRPHRGLSWLLARLADERERLDELAVGDLAVRANIDVSYHLLDDDDRLALRALGKLGPPTFTARSAGPSLGVGTEKAGAILDSLADHQMLEIMPRESGKDPEYRFPELIRLFAHELPDTEGFVSVPTGSNRPERSQGPVPERRSGAGGAAQATPATEGAPKRAG